MAKIAGAPFLSITSRACSLIFSEVPSVVQIGENRSAEGSAPNPPGPIADKFFAIGAFAGFLGGAGLGVRLWMILNGSASASAAFASMREMHSVIQLYLFFGLFISGFLIQVGPRMLKLSVRPGRGSMLISVSLLIGGGLEILSPLSIWPRIFLFLPFAALLGAFVELVRRSKEEERSKLGIWMLLCIGSFAVGAFSPISQPSVALTLFWFSVGSIVLATGRQFIVGFLGGRRMSGGENLTLLALFFLTGILFLGYIASEQLILLRLGGISAFLTFGSYLWWMRLGSSPKQMVFAAIGYSFTFAALWMLLGALSLIIYGIPDVALHLWSIGWVSSLIFGISAQMLRTLAGSFLLGDAEMKLLLLLWQIVAIGRAGGRIWGPEYAMPTAVAWAAGAVLLLWGGAVVCAAVNVVLRKRA